MNLDCWTSDQLRVGPEVRLSTEIFMLGLMTNILSAPHIQKVAVRASGEFDKSSGEVLYSADATVSVMAPGNSIEEYRYPYEADALEAAIERMDESDSEAIAEYRQTLHWLRQFLGQTVECGELNQADFWRTHDRFVVYPEHRMAHIDGSDLDDVGYADAVFGRVREPIPLERPPARWTPYELSRIERRLKAGMDPQAMDDGGQNALNAAVWHGFSTPILALLRSGVDVNAVDVSGVTPLATAVHRNRPDLIDLLLQEGANLEGPPLARTALFALNAERGMPLQELLDRGIDLSVTMPDGGRLCEDPERYALRADDARLIRSHLTANVIESAMADGDARIPRNRDFML